MRHLTLPISFILLFFLMLALFYLDVHFQVKIDFSSFYSSIRSFKLNLSPYVTQPLSFLNSPVTGSINLNTPFFVLLISPLATLPYDVALFIWQFGSFVSLVLSTRYILKLHGLYQTRFILAFFFSFPFIMNAFIGQIGAYVFASVTLGYYFFKNKHPIWAGIFWGGITGIKLFTGLLVIYALFKKDYRTVISFLVTLAITLLFPLVLVGENIYLGYFEAVKSINWYEHIWNGSLFGFLIRSKVFTLITTDPVTIRYLSTCFLGLFSLSYLYLMSLKKEKWQHQSFNLTLIYMLLLNPLGWFYYFLLLLNPLASMASMDKNFSLPKKITFLLFFLLLAFPRNSNEVKVATLMPIRLSIGSQYFYALMLGLGLLLWKDKKNKLIEKYKSLYAFLTIMIVFFVYSATFYFTISNFSKLFLGKSIHLTS